jgi:tetratricopeptide (TPR) repeat protein
MNKYKVYVYAICKNEEQFVERWVKSMNEADGIFVLDTGSTDKTVKKLKKLGVHVKRKKIKPWRFDEARNESMKFIPKDADICVCTDLDEVFQPGWRNKLEKNWSSTTTKARYTYNWSLDENNKPKVSFYIEKIHSPENYKWTHPVHEVLTFTGEDEHTITIDGIILNHYPDSSKSRSSYLPLLELSVLESPEDDRNMHYLGREYMYYGKWNECIDTLIKHLNLKSAVWKDERSASMRFIARSYKNLHRPLEAKMWLQKAIEETPYLRDPYVEYALLEYEYGNYQEVYFYCLEALKITEHTKSYIHEVFSWDNTIYDLLSISSFYLGKIEESAHYIDLAIEYNPHDERLLKNHDIIYKELSSIKE